jgi:hypothetical protein
VETFSIVLAEPELFCKLKRHFHRCAQPPPRAENTALHSNDKFFPSNAITKGEPREMLLNFPAQDEPGLAAQAVGLRAFAPDGDCIGPRQMLKSRAPAQADASRFQCRRCGYWPAMGAKWLYMNRPDRYAALRLANMSGAVKNRNLLALRVSDF